jgi:hypothetical protein
MLVFDEKPLLEPIIIKGLKTPIPQLGYTTVKEEAAIDEVRAAITTDNSDNTFFWCRLLSAWLSVRLKSPIKDDLLDAPRAILDELRNFYLRERSAGQSPLEEAIEKMIAENLKLQRTITELTEERDHLKTLIGTGTTSTGESDDTIPVTQDSH